MREAYDTNMGQYAHANEPIHHLLYMYNYAGTPYKTQQHVRAVLDQDSGLYGPGYDGRGYLGDEDNGQMSAWFVFSALGFYPASPGHPEYALGSPLFQRITLHLESGDFVIDAQGNSDQNRYVQGATLDGAEHTKNFLTHAQLTAGGTLELEMGPEPSTWGSAAADVPSSMTRTARAPLPMLDRALGGTASASEENAANGEGAAQAFDDDSGTKWLTNATQGTLTYRFAAERRYVVSLYTLTSGDDEPARDPKSWELQASNDGTSWTTLDARSDESFAFRRQTRVFAADNHTPYAYYRLEVVANAGAPLTQLAELELLGNAPVETGGASGSEPCAADETPAQAVDGKLFTKFCSQQERPELVVDLGRSCVVSQVVIKHAGAGGEDAAWNTRAFELSLSEDGERFDLVAGVSDNTANETQHTLAPRDARYVRLAVVTPTQSDDPATRILELETYAQCPDEPESGEDGGVGDGDGDPDGDEGDGDGDGDGDGANDDSDAADDDDAGSDTGDLDCSCGIARREVTVAWYLPLAALPLALWLRRRRRVRAR
jgi:hypothetical protein